jgi:hypothetical protein
VVRGDGGDEGAAEGVGHAAEHRARHAAAGAEKRQRAEAKGTSGLVRIRERPGSQLNNFFYAQLVLYSPIETAKSRPTRWDTKSGRGSQTICLADPGPCLSLSELVHEHTCYKNEAYKRHQIKQNVTSEVHRSFQGRNTRFPFSSKSIRPPSSC